MKQQAESYLRQALGDPKAVFHDGQWESIEQLLNRKPYLFCTAYWFWKKHGLFSRYKNVA